MSTSKSYYPVTVQVPEELVLAYQRAAHSLLETLVDGSEGSEFRPLDSAVALARFPDVWALPQWGSGADDDLRADWVFEQRHEGDSSEPRSITEALLMVKDGLSAEKLAEIAGYENGARSIPPALRYLAQRCRQVTRRPFWIIEETADGKVYKMSPDARPFFGTAFRSL